MDIVRIKRFLACVALLLPAGLAQAGNLNFNGAAVASCTLAGSQYRCATLALGDSDSLTIASGYALTVTGGGVTFGSNQGLTMSGSAALTVGGSLDIGSVKSANLHVSGGTLTASNGDFGMRGQSISANINASGTITLGNGSVVNGNLVAPIVELSAAHVEVNGDVTASDALFIGANNALYGDVVAGTVTLHAAKAYIGGNARVDAITLGNKGRVAGTITCNNASADAPCSCVTNDSHYAIGTTMGPHCSASQAVGPHHILISHDGAGLTCQPETVTLTACANAACTPPHHSEMPSVLLTPGGEDFDIDAGGVNSAATVRRTTPGTAALKAISSPAALNPYTCVNTSAPQSATPCNMEFADTGFEMSIANHVSYKTAALTLRALKNSGNKEACTPMFAGARTVDFACAYVNPGSGTLPVQLGLSAVSMGTCGAAGIDLTFDSAGAASLLFRYADVGRVRVDASYEPTSGDDAGLKMTGSTSVVVAPASFRFDAIKAGGTDNPAPGDGDAAGQVFTKAGKAFSVTITAVNDDKQTTPNFGAELVSETVAFKPVRVLPEPPSPPSTDGPGKLSGGVSPLFVKGIATASDLDWSEVGIIKIAADLANPNGYLGDAGNNLLTVKSASVNVGRFIPDHFDTAVLPAGEQTSGVPMKCAAGLVECADPTAGFAYSGQEFGLKLTALNAKSAVTENYSGALAKDVVLTGWHTAGGVVQNFPAGDPRYSITAGSAEAAKAAAVRFDKGVSETKQIYAFRVDTPPLLGSVIPPLPSRVFLRAVDADGASSLRGAASVEGDLIIVSGRMLIPNNYGSELLPMTINLRAQLRNAAGVWVTNTADGASPVVPSALRFIGCKKNLVDSKTAACKAALQVAGLVGEPGTVHFVKGLAAFRLLAPGAGNNGSANLQFLAPGNPSNPSSVFLPSAPGQATFGIYKAGPVIYLRELYN